jgi:hypothetical protein
MKEVKVCDDDWNGSGKEEFDFVNHSTTDTAHITQYGTATWPFQEAAPIVVNPKTASGPGKTTCHLADLADNTYQYYVDICPTAGAPKNVTIP